MPVATHKTTAASLTEGMPWLVFKVSDQAYAVNSQNITTIFQRVQPVLPMPQCSEAVRGVINLRGEVIPLVELRFLLGLPSFAQEHEEFCRMIDARKGDHVRWVDELSRCVAQDQCFTLTTDPHKCAFGKWYDKFHTDRFALATHLKKIDEPHCALHRIALDIFSCSPSQGGCVEHQQKLLRKATHGLMPKILSLMDEAKDVFLKDYREMCIVITRENTRLGILVDDIRAVESLTPINENEWEKNASQLVSYVAKGQSASDNVLVINEEAIFQKVKLDQSLSLALAMDTENTA